MLFDDYAREIRTMGECYLVAERGDYRIVATSAIQAGPDGLVLDGKPLPNDAALFRFFRPHPKYRGLPEAKPDATDAAIAKWLVADLLKAGGS